MMAAGSGLASVAVAIGLSLWRARDLKKLDTYGSARWAGASEIGAAHLLDDQGTVLGRWHKQYLRHDGPEHVLCFAPTRSGKGVGLGLWDCYREQRVGLWPVAVVAVDHLDFADSCDDHGAILCSCAASRRSRSNTSCTIR